MNLPIPDSPTPSLDELREGVSKKRRRKFVVRTSGSIAAIVFAMLLLHAMSAGQVNNQSMVDDRERVNLTGDGSVQIVSDNTSSGKSSTLNLKPLSESDAKSINDVSESFRILASIQTQVPIFDSVDRTNPNKGYRHVGWVKSHRTVPVRFESYTDRDRETLDALLRSDPVVTRISL